MTTRFLPSSLLGRLLAALIAAGFMVVALFFVAFALMGIAIVAATLAGRLWWLRRQLRAQHDRHVIEGSYSVEPAARVGHADTAHSKDPPVQRN